MIPFRSPLRRSPELRRQVALALAVAEDRLLDAHVDAALDFLAATDGALPFDHALEIFDRVMVVPDRIRGEVARRAMTELARNGGGSPSVLAQDGGDDEVGILGSIRRRLRGRRRNELRERIDQAAQDARGRLQGAYLAGATEVIETLQGSVSAAEAVQLYLDALEIGPGWAEEVFHTAVGETEAASQ